MKLTLWMCLFIPLVLVIEVRTYRCGSEAIRYNSNRLVCCKGELHQKNKDGSEQKCCNGVLYKTNQQQCHGDQLRNKTIVEGLIWCENHFRSTGRCCDNVYYQEGKETDTCCGKLLNNGNRYTCCNGTLHRRNSTMKCCKGNSMVYNVKTHWCNRDQILPQGENMCYSKRYSVNNQICCHDDKKIINKTRKDDNACCQTTTFNNQKYFCENGKLNDIEIYKPNTATCNNSNIDTEKDGCCHGKPYNLLNEKCCGGTILANYEKCCNGKKIDTKTHTCCRSEYKEKQVKKSKPDHSECCFLGNGSEQTYNINEQICSEALGQIIPKGPMCGIHFYNDTKNLCCDGIFYTNGKVVNMECCGIKAYSTENETCDDGEIKALILKRKKHVSHCGLNEYNKSTDLCCKGVLYRGEVLQNKSCCGIKSIFDKNQTCKFGTTVETISSNACPSFCHSIWIKNPQKLKIWKRIKHDVKYKVYSVEYLNNTWTVKSRRTQKKITGMNNCQCAYGNKKRLLLITRRIRKNGEIRDLTYLMPNTKRYYKLFVKLLLKEIQKQKKTKITPQLIKNIKRRIRKQRKKRKIETRKS